MKTCDDLGVPIVPEKTVVPSTVLFLAGIKLDTCKLEARLPQDKIDKCANMLQDSLKCKKVTLKDMKSLIVWLNFTCSVVVPGQEEHFSGE